MHVVCMDREMIRSQKTLLVGALLGGIFLIMAIISTQQGEYSEQPVLIDDQELYRRQQTEFHDALGYSSDNTFTNSSTPRIVCLILTIQSTIKTKGKAIMDTWGPRCDKLYFVLNTKERGDHIINSPMEEKRTSIIHKVKFAFSFIYEHHKNDFDWLLKVDDDTYVIVENLRHLVSRYDAAKPGYIGYHFKKFVSSGYMSGGAGYVISNEGFKMLHEKGLLTDKCPLIKHDYDPEQSEDIEIGRCMNVSGVPVLDSRDMLGRETFHTHRLNTHLFGPLPGFLFEYSNQAPRKGPECCSEFSISYHYMSPEDMLIMDHLLYRTSVHGRSASRCTKP